MLTEDVVQDMKLRNFLNDSYTKTSFVRWDVYQYSFRYKTFLNYPPPLLFMIYRHAPRPQRPKQVRTRSQQATVEDMSDRFTPEVCE
jgi:hypothetical protein